MGSIEVESRNIGRIIGARGATIKQLQSDFGVNISISKEENAAGNRVVDISGDDDDAIERAIAAIRDRFGGNRGRYDDQSSRGDPSRSDSRSCNQEQSSNNYSRPKHVQQSMSVEDDEWDKASPSVSKPQYQQKPYQASSKDDWDETDKTSYQPSANTYQSSGSSSFEQPRSYNRDNNSYGGDRQRGYGGRGYSFTRSDSRPSYSRDNKIPYRNHDEQTTSSAPAPVDDFAPIDWDAANKEAEQARKERWAKCPKMIKDFYEEDPEVTNMSEEDVEIFRKENKNIVIARTFAEEGSTESMPKPTTKFEHAFAKFPDLMAEIKKAGFEKPSPIQSQMWPVLLRGEDCIGIAQTGTGKTLAFLLPALIHTDGQPHARGVAARGGPNVLVLAPTRELAIQIEKEVGKYQFRGIRAVCLYGGNDRKKQIDIVESGVEIIIATPGRLNDLVAANYIKIESITYLVLDEADRMLDMGFEPQIRKLLLDIRDDRQTVMTSATWPAGVRRLASSYMSNPYQVFIGSLDLAATHTVTQIIEIMLEEEKLNRILRFVREEMTPDDKAIIFCGRKDGADSLSTELVLKHVDCQCIHGNRDQSDREQALEDIKSGLVKILIATDVASRGIDIEDITYVINYDFPRNIEEYVHRVGRTGRANRRGTSLSFFTRGNWGSAAELIEIMKEAEQEIPQELYEMAERFKAKKEREKSERGMFGGRGGRGHGGGDRSGGFGGNRSGGFGGGNRRGGDRW